MTDNENKLTRRELLAVLALGLAIAGICAVVALWPRKPPAASLAAAMPVHVVTDPRLGLRGAVQMALQPA